MKKPLGRVCSLKRFTAHTILSVEKTNDKTICANMHMCIETGYVAVVASRKSCKDYCKGARMVLKGCVGASQEL